jgi:hypothetical protein
MPCNQWFLVYFTIIFQLQLVDSVRLQSVIVNDELEMVMAYFKAVSTFVCRAWKIMKVLNQVSQSLDWGSSPIASSSFPSVALLISCNYSMARISQSVSFMTFLVSYDTCTASDGLYTHDQYFWQTYGTICMILTVTSEK